MVDGLSGIPKNPINPAVSSKGNKLGIRDTITILKERNMIRTNDEVMTKAKANEDNKLSNKYCVPF